MTVEVNRPRPKLSPAESVCHHEVFAGAKRLESLPPLIFAAQWGCFPRFWADFRLFSAVAYPLLNGSGTI